MSAPQIFGELRALAHGQPSSWRFERLAWLAERCWVVDPEGYAQQLEPYLLTLLSRWPDAARQVPPRWMSWLARSPTPAPLRLCRALDMAGSSLRLRSLGQSLGQVGLALTELDLRSQQVHADALGALLGAGSIQRLALRADQLDAQALEVLLSQGPTRLRSLRVEHADASLLAQLVAKPWPALHALELTLGPGAAWDDRCARWAQRQRLRRLDVRSGSPLRGSPALEAIGVVWPELEAVAWHAVEDEAALCAALAQLPTTTRSICVSLRPQASPLRFAPWLPWRALRELGLTGATRWADAQTLADWLRSPAAQDLHTLHLEGADEVVLEALAGPRAPASLRHLTLHRLRGPWPALGAPPWADSLQTLSCSGGASASASLWSLALQTRWPALESMQLHLSAPQDPACPQALGACGQLARLEARALSPALARLLLAWAPQGLIELGLGASGGESLARLVDAPCVQTLERLSVEADAAHERAMLEALAEGGQGRRLRAVQVQSRVEPALLERLAASSAWDPQLELRFPDGDQPWLHTVTLRAWAR